MKTITIQDDERDFDEGIFLINPRWVHLNKFELKKHLEKDDKIFKVNFDED